MNLPETATPIQMLELVQYLEEQGRSKGWSTNMKPIPQIAEDNMACTMTKYTNKEWSVEVASTKGWDIKCVDTGETVEVIGKSLTNVFVPTTPNPTSGFLLMLPPEDIYHLTMSVGEGMKMLISGGAVIPPSTIKNLKKAGRRKPTISSKKKAESKKPASSSKKASKPRSNRRTNTKTTPSSD